MKLTKEQIKLIERLAEYGIAKDQIILTLK